MLHCTVHINYSTCNLCFLKDMLVITHCDFKEHIILSTVSPPENCDLAQHNFDVFLQLHNFEVECNFCAT